LKVYIVCEVAGQDLEPWTLQTIISPKFHNANDTTYVLFLCRFSACQSLRSNRHFGTFHVATDGSIMRFRGISTTL
jgi:hypothetical protein